ncbi:MAG TPA: universal stress protein [Elusimicrobiota bacterium]|jgi:nucleotide-binding universal stress UspA family protein|nr:universal stress protein [Elusimicrobiota bacterium]
MTTGPAWRFPPRSILVPLDLTDASLGAWEQAGALAARFGAQRKGLYVQEWLHAALGLGGGDPYLTAELSRLALEKFRARLGDEADVSSAPGDAEDTIVSWGRDLGFDLVVMGTHARTGLARALQGSVAEAVVRRATIPVLVAREPRARMGKILAPVSLETHSFGALAYAAELAARLQAELILLHVLNAPLYGDAAAARGSSELLLRALEALPKALREGCRPRTVLAFGEPAEQIVLAAAEADAVVLAAHRRGFLQDALLGTTAERVLRQCPTPVWTVPTAAAPARAQSQPATGWVPAK